MPATATAFHLSTDAALDPGDVLLASRAVPPLAAGATSTATVHLVIPTGTAAGGYYVIAQADAGGMVPEVSETNNLFARFTRIGPDLVVSALTAPTSAAPGATIAVDDTTRNQGGAPADPSTTTFYLSTNGTLDASDVLLGSRPVPALAAGATSLASTAPVVLAGLSAGTYWVIARADGGDVLLEALETNNTRSRGIQLSP